jgi:TPP-dependent pyruvate/acetoin dehydrogenase alpha subunit
MLELLKQMSIRRFEDKCAELYTQEKIRGFMHVYDGEEAVAVGVIAALEKRDRIVATYREHGQALERGVPMTRSWRRCMASSRAAAADAAVQCVCSAPRPTSTAATPSLAAAR